MKTLKRLFDFYLQSSMHVALSVYALIGVTEIELGIFPNAMMAGFGFFGTVIGYNFVKYDALARSGKPAMNLNLKLFIFVSAAAFLGAVYCFWQLNLNTKIVSAACVLVTALYTLPFFPNHTNARSWAGLKIYIVALCWVGVTVVLPVVNGGAAFNSDFYIVCIKRFLLVVVLLFIFEIIDLAWDDPHLKTVPQQFGIKRTKQMGIFLLAIFLFLELFQMNQHWKYFSASIFLIAIISIFLAFANERRSRYYTAFWAESIPIFWWLMLLVLNRL